MYPRLSDLTRDLFGFELPLPIYSFGAMVAVAILTAAWLLGKELDRKHRLGLLPGILYPEKDPKTKRTVTRHVPPSILVGRIAMIAAIAGIVGAKLFHILENLDDFARDPAGMVFSPGGLTFYGGLLLAAGIIAWFVRRRGLSVPVVADAVAPGLILAYGIGRIGCYLAGDGDWGVCSRLEDKPGWLPGPLWSETFPRNVAGPEMSVHDVKADCLTPGGSMPFVAGADGVFPTMLYEFAMCVLAFALLWIIRKHPYRAGWLFGVYVILTAVERFLIELIRVNNEFPLFGLQVTQAQVISVLLLIGGLVIVARTMKRTGTPEAPMTPAAAPTHAGTP
ncbi:MAG TPA: prolipoprotein diacylglyceryl transferase [Rhodothermales bacterium]|nr:prolipoprotein diacylglyceryl transferase [Rhodothermales bacterium]